MKTVFSRREINKDDVAMQTGSKMNSGPRHTARSHVVFDVASSFLNLSNVCENSDVVNLMKISPPGENNLSSFTALILLRDASSLKSRCVCLICLIYNSN